MSLNILVVNSLKIKTNNCSKYYSSNIYQGYPRIFQINNRKKFINKELPDTFRK